MKKNSILWLGLLLLWACSDGNGTGSVIDISNPDDSESIELSSSDIQSSSSSETKEEKSCSSSTVKSSSSSSVNKKNSSSSEQTSSSSKDSKSSSSNSESNSSSSENSESGSSSSDNSESGSSTSSNPESSSSSSDNTVSSSSSSKPSSSAQSSSSLKLIATEISPIRIQSLGISPNADMTVFVLSGIAYIDAFDTTAISDLAPFFTKVDFFLVHVNEQGQTESALPQVQYTSQTMPREAINFGDMGVKIVDSAKAQCGTFKLFVILKASNSPEINDMFITIDSVEFVRDPIYCPEPGSSSSTIEPVELIQYNGQMKTSTTNGYSFKKGAEVPLKDAQIQVTMDELTGRFTLHGVNGYKVTRYSNDQDHENDDDWSATLLPPAPAHTTDFRFALTRLADATDFEKEAFWVVIGPDFDNKTADDFYTVALKESELIAGKNAAQLEIVYYKK